MSFDARTSRKEYNDRQKWYKKKYVSNNQLTQDAVVEGVFYSKDTIPLKCGMVQVGDIMVNQCSITIETKDYVDIEQDDFVLYGNYLYRVNSITKDDANESKLYSNRPSIKSTIELIR